MGGRTSVGPSTSGLKNPPTPAPVGLPGPAPLVLEPSSSSWDLGGGVRYYPSGIPTQYPTWYTHPGTPSDVHQLGSTPDDRPRDHWDMHK